MVTRWGVLGCAAIARTAVLPAMLADPDSVVTAVASRAGDRAEWPADLPADVARTDDYTQLLRRDDVDAVYVPLPNSEHHRWARAALEHGKSVLVEKPAVCTVAAAEELVRLADDAGLLLMEAFMFRWHPQWQLVHDWLDRAGSPLVISAHIGWHLDETKRADDIRLRPELDGGALLDIGCYPVAAATWLLGPCASAVALERERDGGGVDRQCCGVLGFPGGSTLTFSSDLEVPWYDSPFVIRAAAGMVSLQHAFNPGTSPVEVVVTGADGDVRRQHVPGADAYLNMVRSFGRIRCAGADSPERTWEAELLLTVARTLERLRGAAIRDGYSRDDH